jgi:hypothetical protein
VWISLAGIDIGKKQFQRLGVDIHAQKFFKPD